MFSSSLLAGVPNPRIWNRCATLSGQGCHQCVSWPRWITGCNQNIFCTIAIHLEKKQVWGPDSAVEWVQCEWKITKQSHSQFVRPVLGKVSLWPVSAVLLLSHLKVSFARGLVHWGSGDIHDACTHLSVTSLLLHSGPDSSDQWRPIQTNNRGPFHYYSLVYKFCSQFVHYWSCALLDILLDQEEDTRDRGSDPEVVMRQVWVTVQTFLLPDRFVKTFCPPLLDYYS